MRLAAILLLLLLAFNCAGYRLVFYFLQNKADAAMTARLDADQYDEADLLTIKIPIKLPYQTAATDFERIDGEIKVEGKIYKYVKRKVERGHLVLLCLPHEVKMQLEDAKHAAFKITHNAPDGKNDATKNIVLKNILSDYDRDAAPWHLPALTLILQHGLSPSQKVTSVFYSPIQQPPEAFVA